MLGDIMQYGGHPGKEYVLVDTSSEFSVSQNGYRRVQGSDEDGNPCDSGLFMLRDSASGKETTVCLMEHGEAILGASPHSGARIYRIDPTIIKKLGWTHLAVPWDAPDPEPAPEHPVPVTQVKPAQPAPR